MIFPDRSARHVRGDPLRVQAADEGGGTSGTLPRLASGHDEGISGKRLLLPRLRGHHEAAKRYVSGRSRRKNIEIRFQINFSFPSIEGYL